MSLPFVTVVTAGLGACGTMPEGLKVVDSPSDVATCRRIASVSPVVPTNGNGPVILNSLTSAPVYPGPGFEADFDRMAAEAKRLGATDLLLHKRRGRDWSYVEGIAYRCPFSLRHPS